MPNSFKKYGSSQVKIGLKDSNGLGLANKTISLNIDGKAHNCTTDLWGFTYFNVNLNPGTYAITFSYGGNVFYKASSGNSSIVISKMGSKINILSKKLAYGDFPHFIVLDDENCGVFNQTLKVNISGTVYNLKTDAFGHAILNKTLQKGNYAANVSLSSNQYSSSNDSFTLSIMDKTKITANDIICRSGDENITAFLKSNNVPLNSKKIHYKILNSLLTIAKEGDINTNNGTIKIPTNGLSDGKYYPSYSFNGDQGHLASHGSSYLYILNNNKIRSNIYCTNNIIHQKGEKLEFYLVDAIGNPIRDKNITIIFNGSDGIKSYNRTSDENGHFSLNINLKSGNYTFYTRFIDDATYHDVAIFTDLIVSLSPDIAYQVNITTKDSDNKDNKDLLIPFGRQIGIYKNNKLYKFTYSYASSGMTKLNNNVYYFFSMENSDTNPKAIPSTAHIMESGFLLYGDGSNVIVKYFGYTNGTASSFSAIYDGKKYGNINISNVTLLSDNRKVASFYFSSEIFTDETKNYLKSKLNKTYTSYKIYKPVTTFFGLMKKQHDVFSNNYDVNSDYVEELYYGDNGLNDKLNKSHWNKNLGYEAIQSFYFSDTVVSKETLADYLNNASGFVGPYRVAYENLLTCLGFRYLSDMLADEISDKYQASRTYWDDYLSGTYLGINGRCFDDIDSAFFSSDSYTYRLSMREYYLKGSALEQYIMKLAGSSTTTCALSEVLKSLLHGNPLQCSNEDNTIIFKLSDNSSELDFNPDGTVASLIYSSLLEGKYLNGGMDLGDFDFSKNSTIISGLNIIMSEENSFNSYLSNYIMSLVDNVTFTDLFNYLTDTKLLASVAGGLLFEAGMIALPTGLPGLALLGVGTVLTAYGSGMLDDLGTDHPGYAKPENQLNFGISMGLNFIGLKWSEGFLKGILYKEFQEKLVTGFIPSIKSYGKDIFEQTFISKYGKMGKIGKTYFLTLIENQIISDLILNRC